MRLALTLAVMASILVPAAATQAAPAKDALPTAPKNIGKLPHADMNELAGMWEYDLNGGKEPVRASMEFTPDQVILSGKNDHYKPALHSVIKTDAEYRVDKSKNIWIVQTAQKSYTYRGNETPKLESADKFPKPQLDVVQLIDANHAKLIQVTPDPGVVGIMTKVSAQSEQPTAQAKPAVTPAALTSQEEPAPEKAMQPPAKSEPEEKDDEEPATQQ